jgi:hypothetical protein
MDSLKKYQEIVKNIIKEYAQFKPFYGEIKTETIFDTERNHYELVHVGWKGGERIHGSVLHVDIIDDKIWIQHDGTEDGIAEELVEAGIPKDKIVLGFRAPEIRKYTGYAIS